MPNAATTNYYTIMTGDWVNIVPITQDSELILLKQYRHGAQIQTREIPAGGIRKGESPEEAARRELTEETGYTSESMELLCARWVNPALQNNRIFTFLCRSCQKTEDQNLDATEDIIVELISEKDWNCFSFAQQLEHGFSSHALLMAILAMNHPKTPS